MNHITPRIGVKGVSANGFPSWHFSTPFLDYTVKLDLMVLEHKIKTVKKIVYACLAPMNDLFILLTGTFFCVSVACSAFSWSSYLLGFSSRVLWSLCDLQFYDISAGVPFLWICLWSGFVWQASSQTLLSLLYLTPLEDGQVWGHIVLSISIISALLLMNFL